MIDKKPRLCSYIPMLIGVQKFEDNLRRNQKGKKSTFSLFGSSNNASNTTIEQEEERFKQQMIVNVRSLGQGARDLGVQVEQGDLAGWTALLETAERNGKASLGLIRGRTLMTRSVCSNSMSSGSLLTSRRIIWSCIICI
jgi:hypothetical protein